METIRGLNHPHVELDWSGSRGPAVGIYRGQDEVLGFYRDFFDTFEHVRIEPDRYIESGNWVIVPNSTYFRGRDGIETTARSTLSFEVRGGRVAQIRLYQETSEALDAAGLTE